MTPLPRTLRPDPASSGGSITVVFKPGAEGEVYPSTRGTPSPNTGGKGNKPNAKNSPRQRKSKVKGPQESFFCLLATQPGPNHDLSASSVKVYDGHVEFVNHENRPR